MKKKLFTLAAISTLFAIQAKAGTQILVQQAAKSTTGFSVLTNDSVKSCQYTVADVTYVNGDREIVIYLNSDRASMVNGSIHLRPDQIPLQEGSIQSSRDVTLTYKNGVLSQKQQVSNDGPTNNDYQLVQLKISSDLKSIIQGYTKKATKGLFTEKSLGEMNCSF